MVLEVLEVQEGQERDYLPRHQVEVDGVQVESLEGRRGKALDRSEVPKEALLVESLVDHRRSTHLEDRRNHRHHHHQRRRRTWIKILLPLCWMVLEEEEEEGRRELQEPLQPMQAEEAIIHHMHHWQLLEQLHHLKQLVLRESLVGLLLPRMSLGAITLLPRTVMHTRPLPLRLIEGIMHLAAPRSQGDPTSQVDLLL